MWILAGQSLDLHRHSWILPQWHPWVLLISTLGLYLRMGTGSQLLHLLSCQQWDGSAVPHWEQGSQSALATSSLPQAW